MDVSKGFLTRIAYKKKVKSSKLDSLLERRVKQHIIEERQREQVSASKPQEPKQVSSTPTPALSTPVRPRSPLKPQALTQTHLTLGEAVKVEEKPSTTETPGQGEVGGQKVEGESRDELSKTTDKIVTPLPSPVIDSTPKDSSSTGENSNSPQHQTTSSPQKLVENERTTGPKEASSGQEVVKLPNVQETTASSLEQQADCVASDVTKAALTENEGSEEPKLKLNAAVTFRSGLDEKDSQDTAPLKPIPQNTEVLGSVHLSTEENGMGPEDSQDNMQDIGDGRTVTGTPEPLSPLPQVNGNDGFGGENMLGNSVVSSNNGMLNNRPQPKVNSIGKDEDEQRLAVSLKDTTQQKPLVNGDLASLNTSTEVRVKENCLASKVEAESKITNSDQDYKPPLKKTKLENNVDTPAEHTPNVHNSTSSFECTETKPSLGVKIIRMAPSPIPSAEESSLSDDFAEENGSGGATEPVKTIITQVTTTSTTTTTTVLSTEMRIAKVPSTTSGEPVVPVVSTTESSAVSTLTTMTKTTVTKILSPGLDGQSEDSQSEMVTQEQKTTLLASVGESTTDASGKTSVSSVTVSEEDSSTKGRVRLLKFSRTKKTRSDTALPSYCKFVTKSSRKSIFVLPHDDLKILARRGGFREVPVFSYNAKPALDIWPYPSPRPTFGITWR